MVMTVILNIVLTKPLLVNSHLGHRIGMNSGASYFKSRIIRTHYACY